MSTLIQKISELETNLSSFHMLQYRMVDGFLVTAKNSGTHWLRFMLSAAIASHLGLPPPTHASGRASDTLIGHPRWPKTHPRAPRIGSSHNIPSAAVAWLGRQRLLALPPTVVLVRDIAEAMVSAHVKWGEALGQPLGAFVRQAAPTRGPVDLWWFVRFFNHWGDMAEAFGPRILVVRYEDLQAAPYYWLRRIGRHYGLEFATPDLDAAMAVAGRAAVRERLDPAYGETIVPDEAVRAAARLEPDDQAALRAILRAALRHDFGYGYARNAA
jgi:hypothetical protein